MHTLHTCRIHYIHPLVYGQDRLWQNAAARKFSGLQANRTDVYWQNSVQGGSRCSAWASGALLSWCDTLRQVYCALPLFPATSVVTVGIQLSMQPVLFLSAVAFSYTVVSIASLYTLRQSQPQMTRKRSGSLTQVPWLSVHCCVQKSLWPVYELSSKYRKDAGVCGPPAKSAFLAVPHQILAHCGTSFHDFYARTWTEDTQYPADAFRSHQT